MEDKINCFRKLDNAASPNWERICVSLFNDTTFKPGKILMRMIKEKQIMDLPLIITQKYRNFDGRIITNEAIVHENGIYDINAQWDCGSTYSHISKELISKLGIYPIRRDKAITSIGSQNVDVYEICILLNNDLIITVDAQEADNIHDTGIDLLIGMDVICKGDFSISTYDNETCFSFRIPSKGLIDFSND